MKKWETFENEIAKYLEKMLKEDDITIKQYGNSDSTIPDIEIKLNTDNQKFFIETKMPSSQTSQFVVEIKENKFIYGNKNKFKTNKFSEDIIEILNKNFNFYKNVNQLGMIVPVPESIAFGWIASNMKNKNVEFIISVDNKNNERIIPVDQFKEFFNVKTILRRKKSGSSNLPQRYYEDFKKNLNNKFNRYELFIENSKLYVKLEKNIPKSECYIDSDLLDNKRYYLSKKNNNVYEVKLTSSTNNPNIIFELSAKNNLDAEIFTIKMLIDYIDSIKN